MFYLAPLQALTHLAFRKAFSSVHASSFDFAVSPFISLTHGDFSPSHRKLRDVLPEENKDAIPPIPQILGKEPLEFVALANALFQLGYHEINWNLGCPMPQVTKKKRGAGLLPYPDEIEKILEFVLPKIKSELSIKMRLGYSNPNEIFSLIPVLNAYPLSNVCIHPRTAAQLYSGDLHLDTLEECLSELNHKIIFNGNICSPDDFENIQSRFPSIHDFMIGRGVLQNPFLLEEIKGLGTGNRTERFSLFHQNLIEELIGNHQHTEDGCLSKMKEYWSYFSVLFGNPTDVFNQIAPTRSLQDFRLVTEGIIFSHKFSNK